MEQVVIIGAGPAGLTAGYELLKKGRYAVTILEASPYIGGISRTVKYHGNRMDLGGHRFFSKNDRVMDWWLQQLPLQGQPAQDDKALGLVREWSPDGPDPEQTDQVMLLRQRISRIYYLRRFFDYPISLKWSTLHNMGFLRTTRAGFSYLSSMVHKRPESSLENFYINRFGKVLYSMFFENYTEKVWGRHPSEISADWGAQRVKGLSIRAILGDMFRRLKPASAQDKKQVETSLIEQFYYPKYGPGQLWEHVAAEIRKMGGRILTDSPVAGLQADEQIMDDTPIIRGVYYLETGRQDPINEGVQDNRPDNKSIKLQEKYLPADFVFSSMPLKDLVAALRNTSVPDGPAAVAAELPYRDFMTVGLLVDRLLLVNETANRTLFNRVPDCWIYIQETGVKIGRLQVFNNWSPYLVADPDHTIWLGLEYFCNEGDDLWTMRDQDFINMAEKELITIGILAPGAVLDACLIRVQKAYPAYFGSYGRIQELIDYLDRWTNLVCIGRNGQHRYNNMDHSMLSAMVAVDQIHHLKQGTPLDKTAIWQVNTEKEYHENKSDKS